MSKTHVCPAAHAGFLDNWLRCLVHNPDTILGPLVAPGMKVADIGCGPGFFSIAMAHLVGKEGKVYCYDLQPEMLEKVSEKIRKDSLEQRVSVHVSSKTDINFVEPVDLILGFYMVHEVGDTRSLLQQCWQALNPGGKMVIAEPYMHVGKKPFLAIGDMAKTIGFQMVTGPRVFFSRTMMLQKA